MQNKLKQQSEDASKKINESQCKVAMLTSRGVTLEDSVRSLEGELRRMSDLYRSHSETSSASLADLEGRNRLLSQQYANAQTEMQSLRDLQQAMLDKERRSMAMKLETQKMLNSRLVDGMKTMENDNKGLVKLLHARDADYMREKKVIQGAPEHYGHWEAQEVTPEDGDVLVSDSDEEERLVFVNPKNQQLKSTVDQLGFCSSWQNYGGEQQVAHPPPRSARSSWPRGRGIRKTKSGGATPRVGCGGISHGLAAPLTVHVLKQDSIAQAEANYS
eukprot:TRINITY_DN6828_c0_g1_i1.p1 TRINITY_DN6828_c0_g1~~TRINITY_DN6828_c0_g1_i1.p1  ORF type:complete len:274 (-),score=71.24 TRINITY_DN6828_c0_g1_i1:253-1074(-)